MEPLFFYGPDKIQFRLDDKEMVVADKAMPFHGIISLGLREFFEAEGLDPEIWHKSAHTIGNYVVTDLDHDLNLIQKQAYICQVLSFASSAVAARRYLESYFGNTHADQSISCELWNIKEGHTSSVWKVSLKNSLNYVIDEFVLNVARDEAAGTDLKHTSEKMQAISKEFPKVKIAKVFDIGTVEFDYFDKMIKVVVTRNEFIAGASEIHYIPEKKIGLSGQFILVERFLTSENKPAHILSIKGRKFKEEETRKIEKEIGFFRKSVSKTFDTELNINEGDLVWDGHNAVIIAVT
jgi:hypothetical protein